MQRLMYVFLLDHNIFGNKGIDSNFLFLLDVVMDVVQNLLHNLFLFVVKIVRIS